MKLIIFLASLVPVFVFSQNNNNDVLNPERLQFKEFKLEADSRASSAVKLPFQKINVIDSRFDTSKIGYIHNADILAGKKRAYKKMGLQGGTANAIETYYNDYYAASFTPNDFELLIVIKRFWISGNSMSNNKRVEVANSVKDNNSIHCKWEYYLGKNENYLPVKRIDTTFIVTEDFKNYLNDELSLKRLFYVKQSLQVLIDVLDFSNAINQFDKQTKKTFAQIQEFNERINNIPVLKDSSFKKGVYLSFDDFKNNRPSIIEFKEMKMHYGKLNANTEIYLEDMKGQTISNYWGYSDGKGFRYGMLGNDKIYRIQNTFCFFIKVVGYTVDRDNQGLYGGSDINTISKDRYETWVPFQIDMETGEVY
jgi:hypothetical protein